MTIVDPQLAKARFDEAIRPLIERPDVYASVGIAIIRYEWPRLTVRLTSRQHSRDLFLEIDATDYNYRPLSGRWVSEDGTPLAQGMGAVPAGNGFHPVGAVLTAPPFLCFRGWLEYHQHASHVGDRWESLREHAEYRPPALLQHIVTELNRPGTALQ